jgi:ABC-2 type transport system permease protein
MLPLYDQLHASLAIAKASLISTFRSPTSVVFSILFPVIFIIVFGSMVDNTVVHMKIAFTPDSDTSNVIYKAITAIGNISVVSNTVPSQNMEDLKKGRLAAIIQIKKDSLNKLFPHYSIVTNTSASSGEVGKLLATLLKNAIATINEKAFPSNASVASLNNRTLPGRMYRQIDFILPGQLGFSLLMAGVFGSAFLLFSLRKNLVLKRLYVAPVSKFYFILGEMLSRVFFHIITFIIIISIGYFGFKFTLSNGITTFLEMLLFSLLGLFIFMGIGLIISGVVQHESSIAPIANTVTLPQILLCGLFFPVENYPHWLQSFCNILPLTFFVDGLRKIAFEGAHIINIPHDVYGLVVWVVLTIITCVKVFRWE